MGVTVNSKHLRSVIDYIAAGAMPEKDYTFGVEIEHLPVRNGTDEAVDLYSENGVEDFLTQLRPYFDPERETWADGHLIGVTRDGIDVSLEPGGQIETSLGPSVSPAQMEEYYSQFRALADPVMEKLDFRLVAYGYQPVSTYDEIRILPTDRYRVMNEYFGRIGSYGLQMMRGSAATQVSIDYFSEKDAIDKMRVASVIGPVLAWFFRNTPYFEGRRNVMPLMRQRMWEQGDPQRVGLTPGLFDERFSWEDYAVDVLSTPLLVANMRETPEYEGSEKEFLAWHRNAAEIYPDRELNDYEVQHILSTHFNDVRLKNFLEFRHWDSLPIERVRRLTEIIGELFYDRVQFEQLIRYFDGIKETDVEAAKAMIQSQGASAQPYGRSLNEWRDSLGLGDVRNDVPGDEHRPHIRQEWGIEARPDPSLQFVEWRPAGNTK
jgi:glutamate--cysteine ligase